MSTRVKRLSWMALAGIVGPTIILLTGTAFNDHSTIKAQQQELSAISPEIKQVRIGMAVVTNELSHIRSDLQEIKAKLK